MKRKFLVLALTILGLKALYTSPEFQEMKQNITQKITVVEEETSKVLNDYIIFQDKTSIADMVKTKEQTTESTLVKEENNNIPGFTDKERQCTEPFELYSELDSLGRCGTAYANVCKELMPTEERGEIGQIKPSGWHTVKYPGIVEGNYLYNRCHLIAFCLAGENANEKNLITGTRYFNVNGMLPYEEKVADYIDKTNNHVLYRVTPVYEGNNLIASGVQMEGWSVEDNGSGICFNVYISNIQPGIEIDYCTGNSWKE